MLGYADDDWLLAPSLDALQDMLNTCEKYNTEHGLKGTLSWSDIFSYIIDFGPLTMKI